MTLARLSDRMFPSFPSLVDRFLEGDWMDIASSNFAGSNSTLPAVNVKEDENEYLIEVAAPGLKREDFNVNYDNGRLTISSESKQEHKDQGDDKYTRCEFRYQSFQRSFNIPENIVDTEKIQARYIDGILHVSLPKLEEAKPKPVKEIPIS